LFPLDLYKNMPGVSSRRDVPGHMGVGKVRLKFRPASEVKKSRWGFVLFLNCLGLILFGFCWSYPNLRYTFIVPLFQRTHMLFNAARRSFRPLNNFSPFVLKDGRIYQSSIGTTSIALLTINLTFMALM
jgi:hypothetical protein